MNLPKKLLKYGTNKKLFFFHSFYIYQTGLKRDRFREQVFATQNGKGFGKSVSSKAVAKAQKYYDVWRKSIGADDTPKTLEKYYKMKYNDKKEYELLQAYVHSVDTGMLIQTNPNRS